jgi:hypothetical protein
VYAPAGRSAPAEADCFGRPATPSARRPATGDRPVGGAAAVDPQQTPGGGETAVGRGLHSFPIQLNLSASVHRMTNSAHQRVLELLKLSSNVNLCKPLAVGGPFSAEDTYRPCRARVAPVGRCSLPNPS